MVSRENLVLAYCILGLVPATGALLALVDAYYVPVPGWAYLAAVIGAGVVVPQFYLEVTRRAEATDGRP